MTKIKRTKPKDLYFDIKSVAELPKIMLMYSIKDNDGFIYPFNSLLIDLSNDEDSIMKMENITKIHGESFLFFNDSFEGMEYLSHNPFAHIKTKPKYDC